MQINIQVAYHSIYGQKIVLKYAFNNSIEWHCIYLNYMNTNYWQATQEITILPELSVLNYKVYLIEQNVEICLLTNSILIDKQTYSKHLNIIHNNVTDYPFLQIHYTKPFANYIYKVNEQISNKAILKTYTHQFIIAYPVLVNNFYLCLTGSANAMNNFNDTKPIFFSFKEGIGTVEMNLENEIFPLEYKVALYDTVKKKIVHYEEGENKSLSKTDFKNEQTLVYCNNNFKKYLWRGAGVNVPLFSLKSKNSWGCGDFSDLKLFINFAKAAGLKLIQLLPINDTVATYTNSDSYPYSAISSFALHPKFLDVGLLAAEYGLTLNATQLLQIQILNRLPKCDDAQVLALKLEVLKLIFLQIQNNFFEKEDWLLFIKENNHWLTNYAIFCALRDHYSTTDFTQWGNDVIFKNEQYYLVKYKNQKVGQDVAFWYFIQFQLHKQLLNVSKYATLNKVWLKADLPIGVGRYSADTWVYPTLFNMQMQAGAPPDAFSAIGQNWRFPTYHIPTMAKDGFDWFKKRMQHLEQYFDAVRIDHVLGIFRIWSIPIANVEGTLGVFEPVNALQKNDIELLQLPEDRLCTPFINEELLYTLFVDDVEVVKQLFFNEHLFKNEYNTQKKLEHFFNQYPNQAKFKNGLYHLLTNVILIKNKAGYHCRINVHETCSYKLLNDEQKLMVNKLYHHYFFERQNELWLNEGLQILQMLKDSTSMLLCAEDLGMVPAFTEGALKLLNIMSLQVQQMPKVDHQLFSNPANADYASVVMPATHDMPPIRLWWEQNRNIGQIVLNEALHLNGTAPYFCEPWLCKKIVQSHLQSPAMWCIFLLQDVLSMYDEYRITKPEDERINNPSNPNHIWNYKMPVCIEELNEDTLIVKEISQMILDSGR